MIASSQFDWEKFWEQTMGPFRNSGVGKRGWQLIARYGSKGCLRLLKDTEGIYILELGGGSGCLSGVVARKLGLKGESLTLIDSSPEAKRTWEQLSSFGIHIQDDFFTHDFEGQKFELVFGGGLIEHWADREERLSVIRKHAELSGRYIMIRVLKKRNGNENIRDNGVGEGGRWLRKTLHT